MSKVLAFGEIMLRLYTQDLEHDATFDYSFGGTEANVLICLSGFGESTKYLTVLPDNALGESVLNKLSNYELDTSSIGRKPGNLGEYMVLGNVKDRAGATLYNRKHSAVAGINVDELDFDAIFADVGWFHISGISFAISQAARNTSFVLLAEAKRRGVKISFDFNYRPALWTTDEAAPVFRQIMPWIDVALASTLDMTTFLGFRRDFAHEFFAAYPNVEHLFLRDRLDDKRGATGRVTVNAYTQQQSATLTDVPFAIYERIGGGDAFNAGVIYALIHRYSLQDAVELGVSAYVLKHTVKGDVMHRPLSDIAGYYSSARVLDKPRILLSVAAMDASFERMREALSALGQVDVCGLTDIDLRGVDIFIGKKLTEQQLQTADRLKGVFAYKTGVDDFPLSTFHQKKVLLCNSHVNSKYIAEYAFGMTISLVNRVCEFDKDLRQGQWKDAENPYWRSIYSMKVGLLGYGEIGKEIHCILQKNDIETYTINRGKIYEGILLTDSFKSLCTTCDVIICSLPKTPDTDEIFNADSLRLLRGKYIVNVGRSNIFNEQALYEALRDGVLAGVANDVWRKKPTAQGEVLLPSKYPFETLHNMVLSPHQAMNVADGHDRYVRDVTDNVVAFIHGRRPRNVVDTKKGY